LRGRPASTPHQLLNSEHWNGCARNVPADRAEHEPPSAARRGLAARSTERAALSIVADPERAIVVDHDGESGTRAAALGGLGRTSHRDVDAHVGINHSDRANGTSTNTGERPPARSLKGCSRRGRPRSSRRIALAMLPIPMGIPICTDRRVAAGVGPKGTSCPEAAIVPGHSRRGDRKHHATSRSRRPS